MTALVVGTLLALAALAYVLFPLFAQEPSARRVSRAAPPAPAHGREEDAVDALREIEFDRATGKLSDTDYEALKATYTARALAAMRARDASVAEQALPVEDAAEAAVQRVRMRLEECATCGPRPEPDAIYCSSCGRYLPGSCAGCGAAITQPGAAYCAGCGRTLAA